MHSLLLHDGELRPISDAILSAGQVGLLSGWGVFSTIKIVDGALFAFPRHWARMRRDADLLRVPFPWTPDELESLLLPLVAANQAWNATLRVTIVRNRGTMWEDPGVERDADLIAFTAPRRQWGEACSLGIVANARHAASPFAGTKTASWAMNLIWYEEARLRGHDEVVLLNERGEVSECTSANLFAVFHGQQTDTVLTPPLGSSGCLPGITRELLLEQIRVPGVEAREQILQLADLEAADGLFITSSTRDMLPVAAIEGLSIRQEQQTRAALLEAYLAYEANYVASAGLRAEPS